MRDLEQQTSIYAAGVSGRRPRVPTDATMYWLALAGEAGVREVVTNFLADFDHDDGLAGCRSVSEISSETLVPAPP